MKRMRSILELCFSRLLYGPNAQTQTKPHKLMKTVPDRQFRGLIEPSHCFTVASQSLRLVTRRERFVPRIGMSGPKNILH